MSLKQPQCQPLVAMEMVCRWAGGGWASEKVGQLAAFAEDISVLLSGMGCKCPFFTSGVTIIQLTECGAVGTPRPTTTLVSGG